MATPTGANYQVGSGKPIYAGRAQYPNELLDLIAAAPESSWLRVNTNTFSSVWPHTDFLPSFGSGVSSPAPIISAWSGFAWDDDNFRMILWGGGHANSSCNEPYYWEAATRRWKLAFMPSDIVTVQGGMGEEPVDGVMNAAQSSHTYQNQQWLPKLKRYFTLGGAAQSTGGAFRIREAPARSGGAYTLDMTFAGLGYLGGSTGSNPKRGIAAGVNLRGARAWKMRDWYLDNNSPALADFTERTNGNSAYREENGRDVVYFKCGPGHLFRIEMRDHNYRNDVITRVGQAWTSGASSGAGALDTRSNVFVVLYEPTNILNGWDLNKAGAENRDFNVQAAGFTGTAAAEFTTLPSNMIPVSGMLFDEKRNYFVVWARGGVLYSVKTPSNLATPTTGWTVEKLSDDTANPRPMTIAESDAAAESDTCICGKWKRSKNLDVYIGLHGKFSGNVWMYKPSGWTDPRSV